MKPTWQSDCGTVTLYRGDCLDVLPTLESGSVDAVVTDPPYGISYQSARRTDKRLWKPKIANDGLPFVWWIKPAADLLAAGGGMLCFCRWDVQEAFRLAIGWAGLRVRSQLVWDRMAHGAGDTAGSPAPQHDVIWYATKGRRIFHGARPKSVVRAMRLGGATLVHPTEKPAALMAGLVDSYAAPGGLVLDPFVGSGSTAAACVRLGRPFVGVELNAGYLRLAVRRIKAALAERKEALAAS